MVKEMLTIRKERKASKIVVVRKNPRKSSYMKLLRGIKYPLRVSLWVTYFLKGVIFLQNKYKN